MSEKKKKKKPARWSRHKERYCPDSYLLCRGGVVLMTVAPEGAGWYFYGCGVNSLDRGRGGYQGPATFATLDEAKREARRWVREDAPRG